MSNRIENVMYTTSYEQRKNALQLLALVQELDGWSAQPELVLGTCLALSFRDVSYIQTDKPGNAKTRSAWPGRMNGKRL